MKHDIERQMRDLNEALSQEKRHLGLLLGAGCPTAIRVSGGAKPLVPDLAGLTESVEAHLDRDASFAIIKEHFVEDSRGKPNIEAILTHVRNLTRIVGSAKARGLDREALIGLEQAICAKIVEVTSVSLPRGGTPYHHLARWIRTIPRTLPVTVFTTNYDLLAEQAMEEEEVPFFDGFTGARQPFFDLRAIEDDELPSRWARLWKLHGSVSWRMLGEPRKRVLRATGMDGISSDVLIHPSDLKYDQSRRMPYLAMFDRLRTFLRRSGAVLITCGYSFADEHINETILEGLATNPGAAVFGLLFKNLDEELGATKLRPTAPRNLTLLARDGAVIRQTAGCWWNGDGAEAGEESDSKAKPEFKLGDFAQFGEFLAHLAVPSPPGAGT